MSRQISVRFESAVAIGVVLITAGVAWQVGTQLQRPLDAEDMKIDVADLGSYAAEGDLLAEQRVGATMTRSYSKVQTQMWRDKIEKIAVKYQSREPEVGLTKSFGEVHALAQRLLSITDMINEKLTKEGTATAAVSELKQVELDARQLKSRPPLTPN